MLRYRKEIGWLYRLLLANGLPLTYHVHELLDRSEYRLMIQFADQGHGAT